MKCPSCRKILEIPTAAYHNAEAYGKPLITIAACCGFAVRITPVTILRAEVVYDVKTDDWGKPCKVRQKVKS